MAATLAYQKAVTTSGGATSRSLSFTSIASAAGQERLVGLVSIASGNPASVTYSNVQIDGQTATQVGSYVTVLDANGNGPTVSFWRAAGTSSTSINVTYTIATGTVFDARGALWTLNNAGTLYDSQAATAINIGNIDLSLNVDTVTGGAVAAMFLAHSSSTRTATWSGLTERYDGTSDHLYSVDWFGAADRDVSSGSTPLTITADLPSDFAGQPGAAGLAVSFNPVSTGISGTLAATEAPDVASLAGLVGRSGTLAATEASDIAAVTGNVAWQAALAATEASDTASLAGTVFVVLTGTLAATEASDTALFSAGAVTTGTLAATEATDTAAFAGAVLSVITGTLAATEASDTAFFSAGAVASGTLAATEAADTAAASGAVRWAAVLAATEAADAAAFTATAVNLGTLAATEAADTASFAGLGGILGAFAAAEASDSAIIVGGVLVAGTITATEASDVSAMRGFVGRITTGEAIPRPPDDGVAIPRSLSGVALPRSLE